MISAVFDFTFARTVPITAKANVKLRRATRREIAVTAATDFAAVEEME
jgi:hypothetical protein